MERYRSAFYAPLVSDWRNFGAWTEDGAKTATQRALEIVDRTLGQYRAPPRDPAILEQLDDYVRKRTAEGGAAPAG
jgi:trimethylamine--corrinoid protein Co-methyltransferase